MMPLPDSPYLAVPGQPFDLSERPTAVDVFESRSEAKSAAKECAEGISELAHKLYAMRGPKLLVLLQGMDTSGKDGTTKALFRRTPPLNLRVAPFKAPTKRELAHDFLWRVHQVVPGAGEIVLFNRSHYEDVLVVKVREFADAETVEQRYGQINDFERLLVESGTTVLKFMLHISPEVQAERLRDRLEDPGKRWKFNPGDLDDRALWPDFMEAYETMVRRTSTEHAPWYVIPSDDKKTRNALIARIVHRTLADMDLHYPDPGYRPEDFEIEEVRIPS
ncbi:MAG: PPK2 family polyphosphate kinase [Litorimonas sp.]